MPHGVLHGGYLGIPINIISGWSCYYACCALRDCLYERNKDGHLERVSTTYAEVGIRAFNSRFVGKLLDIVQLLHGGFACVFFHLCSSVLLYEWLIDLPVDLTSWIMVCTMVLLPCSLLESLRKVSFLSFIGTVVQIIITIFVIVYCCIRHEEWRWSNLTGPVHIWPLSRSVSIITVTYSSTVFIPMLEYNMFDKDKFDCSMKWSHFCAVIVKILISVPVILTWGTSTKSAFTNNLPLWPFRYMTNPFLVIKGLSGYPFPYHYTIDVIKTTFFTVDKTDSNFNEHTRLYDTGESKYSSSCYDADDKLKTWAVTLRLGFILLVMLLAISIPYLTYVLGLICCITGFSSLIIFPALLHLKVKWTCLDILTKFKDMFLISYGCVFSILGLYYNVLSLIRIYNGLSEYPDDINVYTHLE